MILEYTDILDNMRKYRIKAIVTTEHPASHYGIPVIVLADGNILDLQSWIKYRVIRCSKTENVLLRKAFSNFIAMMGGDNNANRS